MNTFKSIIGCVAFSCMLGACNDSSMDRYPIEKQSEETAFKTSTNFQTYAWSLYSIFTNSSNNITRSYIASGANQSYWSGEVLANYVRNGRNTGIANAYADHRVNANNTSGWNFSYIRRANIMLDHIETSEMNDSEKAFARKAIESYKAYRDLVYYGDLYRLGSPYEDDSYALMYANEDKTRAVVFAYTLKYMGRTQRPLFRLSGLDAEKNYRVTELNVEKSCFWGSGKTFSGSYLKNHGLNPNMEKLYSSAIFYLEAE